MRRILASSVSSRWPLPMRVAARAAVAEGDVEHPVRSERDRPAVVVRERLVDMEQDVLAGGVGDVGVAGTDPVRRRRPCCRRGPCSRRRSAGRSGSPGGRRGRAARARRRSRSLAVMSRNGRSTSVAVAHDPDPSGLLDDEEAAAPVGRIRDVDRVGQTVDRDRHVDRHLRRVERAGGRRGGRAPRPRPSRPRPSSARATRAAPDALATWVAAGVAVGGGVASGEQAAEIRTTRATAATRIRTIGRC